MTLENIIALTQRIANGGVDVPTLRELDILLESVSFSSDRASLDVLSSNFLSSLGLNQASKASPTNLPLEFISYKPLLMSQLLPLDVVYEKMLAGSLNISLECTLLAIRIYNRIMPKWKVPLEDTRSDPSGISIIDTALQRNLVSYITGTTYVAEGKEVDDEVVNKKDEKEGAEDKLNSEIFLTFVHDMVHREGHVVKTSQANASQILNTLWNTNQTKIQIFVLEQLGRIGLKGYYDQWDELNSVKGYLYIILEAFKQEEIAITKMSVDVILHVFCLKDDDSYGHWLFSSMVDFDNMSDSIAEFQLIEKIRRQSKESVILHLRYLEFIVALCSKSEYYFNLCQRANLIDEIVNELVNSEDDVLAMLNVLELTQKLIIIPYSSAVEYVISAKVFEIVSTQLFETYAGDALLEEFLISAIGQMTTIIGNHITSTLQQVKSKSVENESKSQEQDVSRKTIFNKALQVLLPVDIFLKICDQLDSDRKNIELISLRVVSCILATSPNCLHAFLQQDSTTDKIREKYFEHFYLTHSTDAHEEFLSGVSQIMASELNSPDLLKQFFECFYNFHKSYKSSNFTQEILSILKSPFSEIRFATYHLIESLSLHPYSAHLLLSSSIFINEMLNRKTETHRACMEKKWSALKELSETIQKHPDLRSMLSNMEFIDIRTYIHRGPFYNDEAQVLILEESA